MRFILLLVIFLLFKPTLHAQENKDLNITGTVLDESGNPVAGVNVLVKDNNLGTSTNFNGFFVLRNLQPKTYTLIFSSIGYKKQLIRKTVSTQNISSIEVTLKTDQSSLSEIVLSGKTQKRKIEEKGFHVTAFETENLKAQSLEINNILDRLSGVRVRRTGGIGSDYEYSLDGMSGNAISFFIDGIPMDYYGSSYSVNNLPVSLIDRIDIYKGVVPVELGSDALGGAINLVTDQRTSNFLNTSYSYGSFNTHQASFHGQWTLKSGFTTKLSAFYKYSENNYKVWGTGVHYADESTGYRAVEFTRENPAERFNDDFKTLSGKLDIGFSDKKWADQFFVSILASDKKQGVQTAQTMARVFGKVRNNEKVLMPSLNYQKKDIIKNFNINAFAAYSYTEGKLIDTSTVQYDWKGEEIGTRTSGGEMGYDGKSLYTQKDQSQIYRFNATYSMLNDFKIGLNYVYSSTRRTGEDPFSPDYRVAYLEPQSIGSHFAGLSLETKKLDDKLNANAFFKFYNYHATINNYEYTNAYEIVEYKNDVSNWGAGFASSYKLSSSVLLKSSLEQATRMPNLTEALGDGVTINNNPYIEPEQSFNINIGMSLGRFKIGQHQGLKLGLNVFYRNIDNKLLFTVLDGQGNGEFRNIDKISGIGAEIDIAYDLNRNVKFTINGTYLDLRNNLKYDENGRDNILYRDRMRNTPYLMGNAGLNYNTEGIIQKGSKFFTYLQSGYVHRFYLGWPSLGTEENKSYIPTQLVFDTGFGYTFPSESFTIAIDITNLFNEQVYDNYLLQKPGRALFLKVNYQIIN